jgi:IPT/TIG domain
VDARYIVGTVTHYVPIEQYTDKMIVKGVFPRRGGTSGGTNLNIYGINFVAGSSSNTTLGLTVAAGTKKCRIKSISSKKIICTLPGGSGTVNITVSTIDGSRISIFQRGYRYITGTPS